MRPICGTPPCHHLQIVEIDWPEPQDGKKKVFLDGLTYESITTRKEPDKREDWQKLLGLAGTEPLQYAELPAARRLISSAAAYGNGPIRSIIAGKRRELGKATMVAPGQLAHPVLLGLAGRLWPQTGADFLDQSGLDYPGRLYS